MDLSMKLAVSKHYFPAFAATPGGREAVQQRKYSAVLPAETDVPDLQTSDKGALKNLMVNKTLSLLFVLNCSCNQILV